MFKIINSQKHIEGAFYLVEGIVLVGLTEDLEEQFRDDISKFGYDVLEINKDTLSRISHHSAYWIFLKKDTQHFEGIERLLDVKVRAGQEEEAVKQLIGIPYVAFAERMHDFISSSNNKIS